MSKKFGSFQDLGKALGQQKSQAEKTNNHAQKVFVWLKKTYKDGRQNKYLFSSKEYEEIPLKNSFYQRGSSEYKKWASYLNSYCFLYADIEFENNTPVISHFLENMAYRLPNDTRILVKKSYHLTDNFNLKLNLFSQFKADKFKFFDNKKLIVKPNFEKKPKQKNNQIPELLIELQKRQKKQVNALCTHHESLKFQPDWRLIVGLGGESVYETSMTLHHIYGIPYIPASAVKGITRQWAINSNPDFELTEEDREKKRFKNSEEKAFKQNKELCDIFGCDEKSIYGKARAGNITFFDAFPTQLTNESIQPDVMNVHYKEYYGGDKPPTDTQNPNPIFFLTVQNTPFQFHIGIKSKHNLSIEPEKLLENTRQWLQEALTEHGIGAKTAVGYGYMRD